MSFSKCADLGTRGSQELGSRDLAIARLVNRKKLKFHRFVDFENKYHEYRKSPIVLVCPLLRNGFRAWLNPGHENILSARRQAMKLVASEYVFPSVHRQAMRLVRRKILASK